MAGRDTESGGAGPLALRWQRALERRAPEQKRHFLRYFLLMAVLGSLLAAYFDQTDGYLLAAAVETFVGVLALWIYFYTLEQSIPAFVVTLTTLMAYLLFSIASISKMGTLAGMVWVSAYPIIFFFVGNLRSGLVWTGLGLATFMAAYLVHPLHAATPRIPFDALVQTMGAYLFVAVLSFFYERIRVEQERLLQTQAEYDFLTNVYNRRGLSHLMEMELSRVRRYATRLSFMLLDVDNFKRVNDTYGHKVGDSVLQELAVLLQDNIRRADVIGRWGGEEFAILMPELQVERAAAMAEKLRALVADHEFSEVGHITISIGVSCCKGAEHADDLVVRADQALYRAKETTKNRVEVEA